MSRRPELDLSDLSVFTRQIAANEAYLAERSKETPELEGRRLATAVKLGALALSESNKSESGYMNREGNIFKLMSTIDDFATSQIKLDALKKRHSTFEERRPHLLNVIDFNHAAKELINQEPSLRFDELTAAIVRMYAASSRYKLPSNQEDRHIQLMGFENNVKSALNGMRHELAYEQMLGELHHLGVDYQETTKEDELRGVDYHISIEGREFGVDVKSSEVGVNKARNKSPKPELIVHSHVTDRDFDGGFRISTETAKKKSTDVYNDLSNAWALAA